MRTSIWFFLALSIFTAGCMENYNFNDRINIFNDKNSIKINRKSSKELIKIENVKINSDKDLDGLTDLMDIVEGARIDAKNKPVYKSQYYRGGYPPDNEGVCTDVIWRAYKNAGYSIKDMIDKDIMEHTDQYPRIFTPDPNIDFRRVVNLNVFFDKYGKRLTNEIIPGDKENLFQWQGGDIVIFANPEHIAIVSAKRREDGVPYMIHNAGPHTVEADHLLLWRDNIIGHFRFPAGDDEQWLNNG